MVSAELLSQTSPAHQIAAELTALVATGAEICSIDVDLAASLNLPSVEWGRMLNGGDPIPMPLHRITVCFLEIDAAHEVVASAQALRRGGLNVDLILGAQFLNSYTVEVSRQRDIVLLRLA